jgi:DNA-binding response OmpR family regulator
MRLAYVPGPGKSVFIGHHDIEHGQIDRVLREAGPGRRRTAHACAMLVRMGRPRLRRANSLPRNCEVAATRYAFGRWILDTGRELTGRDGIAVLPSTAKVRLLVALLERPRLVLTRDELLDLTSGRSSRPFDGSIDKQVFRLCRKTEWDPTDAN